MTLPRDPEIATGHTPRDVEKRLVGWTLYELASKARPPGFVAIRLHGRLESDGAIRLTHARDNLAPPALHPELGIAAVL
jgi:hypothetical protein